VSDHFCATCNRLRLTCEGRLRTCLFSDREYALREIIRRPELGEPYALRVVRAALKCKPLGRELLEAAGAGAVCGSGMVGIGG